MRLCSLFIVVLIVGLILFGQASRVMAVGESVAPSLIIPPGARANGMGEAYVAISDDATAPWWNAAGLGFLKKSNIAFMHTSLVPSLATDVYYEYFGFSREVSGLGAYGFSAVYLSYGEQQFVEGPQSPEIPFKSWEGYLMASLGIRLVENLSFGLSMKFIYVNLAPAWANRGRKGAGSSVALDVGSLWKLPRWRTQLGLTVSNIGPDINFEDKEQPNPLPTTLRLGAVVGVLSDEISNLLFIVEAEQSLVWLVQRHITTREREIWHLGAEYQYINLISGRLGYKYDRDGDIKGMTYGLGFNYKSLKFDYASVPLARSLADRVNRWSISVAF